MLINTQEYLSIIENIKQEIKAAQYRATIHANSDLLLLYYDIGTVINEYKTWGNKFIDNLSYDIQIAFPERKGYSVRNLKYMAKFATRFLDRKIVQEVLAQIPWGHNIVLLDKVADIDERKRYIKKSAENDWSRIENSYVEHIGVEAIKDRQWAIVPVPILCLQKKLDTFSSLLYTPIFDSKIEQNTAGRLVLHSFPSSAFSFYYIVFFSIEQVYKNFLRFYRWLFTEFLDFFHFSLSNEFVICLKSTYFM